MPHYGEIASKYYDYKVAVIDLRNPTKSDGNNLLHLVNKYMDLWKKEPKRAFVKKLYGKKRDMKKKREENYQYRRKRQGKAVKPSVKRQ